MEHILRLDLTKRVKRGTNHVTNYHFSIEAKIDMDGDFFTPIPIPFCDGDKIVPLDGKEKTFYVNDINSLFAGGFDEIKITPLKK